MARRFQSKELHSVVWEACDAFTSGVLHQDPEAVRVYGKHSSAWFKEYGAGLMSFIVGWTVALLGIAALGRWIGLPLIVFLGFFAAIGHGIYLFAKNSRTATAAELRILMPALKLGEVERTYLDAFLSVEESPASRGDKQQVFERLNHLVDAYVRLRDRSKELEAHLGTGGSLAEQVRTLEGKIQQVQDPQAKATFEQSLEIARRRAERGMSLQVEVERIEAQTLLIQHTLEEVRETYSRWKGGPSPEQPGLLDLIQTTTRSVQDESVALDRALQELQA